MLCLVDHEFFGETAHVRALTRDGNNVSTGVNGFAAKIEPAGRARFYRITYFVVGVPDKRSAKGRLLRRFVEHFFKVGNGHKLVGYCHRGRFFNFIVRGCGNRADRDVQICLFCARSVRRACNRYSKHKDKAHCKTKYKYKHKYLRFIRLCVCHNIISLFGFLGDILHKTRLYVVDMLH